MRELALALVPALGTTLLHFLWQGALIGAIAALALQALRDAQPQARYTVACLALVACVLAPLATFVAQLVVLMPSGAGVDPALAPVVVETGGLAFVARDSSASFAGLGAAMPWIVTAWASGALTSAVRIAWGLAWIRSLKPAAPVALQVAWQRRLDAIARHFALGRPVELRLVDRLDTPAAIGWMRPVVLLPTALVARMPVELVEALLAHELAHVRRHDYLVNLLQSAVEALLFYHPVVWWLSRRIRDEREQIADRLAAEVACPPRRLARALADLADFNAQPPLTELVLAAQGGQLMSRIQRLVRPAVPARPGAGLVLSLLGLAAVGAATFTYAQSGANADPASNFITAATAATAAVPAAAPDAPVVAVHAAPVVASRTVVAAKPAVTVNVSGGTVINHDDDDDDTIALIDPRREGITMWGSLEDLAAIEATKKQIRSEFLWVHRGEQAYVVTDATVIARAREAMREAEEHGRRMEVLGEEMEVHGRKMEALGERMEALSDQRDTPEMKALERQMDTLGRQQEALGRKQEALAERQPDEDEDPAAWRRFESEMDALSRQQDALSGQMDRLSSTMDATHERLEAPMEALSREMDAASEPMEALGEKLEALGEEHEKLTEQSLRKIRLVVDEAIARGLARPARVNVQID